jgi:hypothetical protein
VQLRSRTKAGLARTRKAGTRLGRRPSQVDMALVEKRHAGGDDLVKSCYALASMRRKRQISRRVRQPSFPTSQHSLPEGFLSPGPSLLRSCWVCSCGPSGHQIDLVKSCYALASMRRKFPALCAVCDSFAGLAKYGSLEDLVALGDFCQTFSYSARCSRGFLFPAANHPQYLR